MILTKVSLMLDIYLLILYQFAARETDHYMK